MNNFFDWEYYLRSNYDLFSHGILTREQAWSHWINHGRNENRKCRPIPKFFNWKLYINKYQDLSDIKNEIIAYEHYFYYGRNEGRICTKIPSYFNWKNYINNYSDLKHISNEMIAYEHYYIFGKKEGRVCNRNLIEEFKKLKIINKQTCKNTISKTGNKLNNNYVETTKNNVKNNENKIKTSINFKYPIFYLNLKRCHNRRLILKNQSKNYNMELNRIEGIDYKRDGTKFIKVNNNSLNTEAELCCLASHLKMMYLSLTSQNNDIVIAIEDDIDLTILKYRIKELEKILTRLPVTWEILQLWTGNIEFYNKNTSKNRKFVKWEGTHLFGMVAYVVHRRALDKLNKIVKKNGQYINLKSIDNSSFVSDDYIYRKFESYTTTTPFVNIYARNSTIHADHLPIHNHSASWVQDWWNNYKSTKFSLK